MNGDKRRIGTNFLALGVIIFLIGVYSEYIEEWIHNWNSSIHIENWGWLLVLIGGLIAAHGFMIYLEEYLLAAGPPMDPNYPQPLPPYRRFVLDVETKRVMWVIIIAGLLFYIASPGLMCQTAFFLIIFIALFFILRGGAPRGIPPPPGYYPPQPRIYQQPPVMPPPQQQSGKVTLCNNCHAQMEFDWISCPLCGQSVESPRKPG